MHRLGDYRGHISIAYQETRPGAVNTLGGGPWPFSAGRPAMAEPGRGGMMGRPSPEPGPAVAARVVCACRGRLTGGGAYRPGAGRSRQPMNSASTSTSRAPAQQTRPPAHAQGRQQATSTASQAETRHHQPAPPAPAERQPSKRAHPRRYQTRDFSSPPLIAIYPLLYPPPSQAAGPPGADEDLCGFESAKID